MHVNYAMEGPVRGGLARLQGVTSKLKRRLRKPTPIYHYNHNIGNHLGTNGIMPKICSFVQTIQGADWAEGKT